MRHDAHKGPPPARVFLFCSLDFIVIVGENFYIYKIIIIIITQPEWKRKMNGGRKSVCFRVLLVRGGGVLMSFYVISSTAYFYFTDIRYVFEVHLLLKSVFRHYRQ